MLVDDSAAFDEPRLPLTELVAAAGLEIRRDLIGDGPMAWRRLAHSRAAFRIVDRADNDEERRAVLDVYLLFERIDEDEPTTPAELRRALDLMTDESVLSIVTDQLFGYDEDPESLDATEVFARRLSAAASKPLQHAVAASLTAMVAERRCDPLAAADALAEAVRQAPDFLPAVDRLAWTRADQGRASEAKALWLRCFSASIPTSRRSTGRPLNSRIGAPAFAVTSRAGAVRAASTRCATCARTNCRPCPTGSAGCCARASATWSVTVRRWTTSFSMRPGCCRRVTRALERGDAASPSSSTSSCTSWAGSTAFSPSAVRLLPEDEQLLYASWQLIPRTVYEIVDVRPGEGLTLRDVRTGDLTEVKERTFSRAASAGQLICSRALPDGEGHQLVGAVIEVPPGREQTFLDILDDPDPTAVARWLAPISGRASRPPTLQTTDGDPMTSARWCLRVDDPEWVRLVLDRRYVTVGAGPLVQGGFDGPEASCWRRSSSPARRSPSRP